MSTDATLSLDEAMRSAVGSARLAGVDITPEWQAAVADAATRPGGIDDLIRERVRDALTAGDVERILDDACPTCGWTAGRHRPAGNTLDACANQTTPPGE